MQQQQQKEVLDSSLEGLSLKILEIKKALTTLLMKLEGNPEAHQWPSVLDSFALLSGQMSFLVNSFMQNQGVHLENAVLLPLKLSQDRDEQLETLTERRVPAFHHEVVPNYLRTKPEPEIDGKEKKLAKEASHITTEQAQTQVATFNRLVDSVLATLQNAKDSWEKDDPQSQRREPTYYNPAETNSLIQAMSSGKGLKVVRQGVPQTPPLSSPSGVPTQLPRPNEQHAPMNKAPSTIKTNIKAGSSMNPYGQR